jgi:hypothetical protein
MSFKSGDLRKPLVEALANMTQTGVEVEYDLLLAEVLRRLGVGVDCMGADPRGKPKFLTPLNNAAFDCKQRGLFSQSRRGVWALTAVGSAWNLDKIPLPPSGYTGPNPNRGVAPVAPVAEPVEAIAERLAAAVTVAPVIEPVTVAPVAETVEPTETVEQLADRLAAAVESAPESAPKPKRVKLARVEDPIKADAPDWVRDPYLRSLVAANTPCFGQYSPSAAACGGCHVTSYCRNAQAASLSVLAAKLADIDAATSAATAKLHDAVATATAPTTARASVTAPPRPMRASYDGVCSRSGVAILAGTTVYYVPGEGLVSESSLTRTERAAV